jgi:excisionase family DNA binding protein
MPRNGVTRDLLDAKEAATFCGVTRKTIYRWLARGWINPARIPNGRMRFTREELITRKAK